MLQIPGRGISLDEDDIVEEIYKHYRALYSKDPYTRQNGAIQEVVLNMIDN